MHLRGQATRKRQRGFASGLAQTQIRAAHRCFFGRLLGRALVPAARVSASPLVSRQAHVISSFCFFSSQIIKKQSALKCRVNRQSSLESICLVKSKKT